MAHENRPSVRFRRIGSALRQAREERRLTLGTASRRFGKSAGWLSTVENGQIPIRVDDLADLLDLYDIDDGPLRESLLYLAAQGRKKNWTRAYEDRVSAGALELAGLESDSEVICSFQPNLIPGLMQIEDYTREVMAAGVQTPTRDEEALVSFRLARQAVLIRPNPPDYICVVGEAALHQLIGDGRVRREQLAKVLDTSQMEHIKLHILPYSAGANLGVAVPFDLFTLRPPGGLTVALVSQVTQSLFIEDEPQVSAHVEIFNHLLDATLDESRSRSLIQRIVSSL